MSGWNDEAVAKMEALQAQFTPAWAPPPMPAAPRLSPLAVVTNQLHTTCNDITLMREMLTVMCEKLGLPYLPEAPVTNVKDASTGLVGDNLLDNLRSIADDCTRQTNLLKETVRRLQQLTGD